MKAVYYDQFQGSARVEMVADPVPERDGVVLQVRASGICRSDWHGWMGHDPDISLPHVPGHELAGVVVAVGADVENWVVGDRVTLPFVGGCGTLPAVPFGQPPGLRRAVPARIYALGFFCRVCGD